MIRPDILYEFQVSKGTWSLAIGIEEFMPGRIGYFDTVRGHSFDGELVREYVDGFDWKLARPPFDVDVFEFRAVTLERFDEFWARSVRLEPDRFRTTAELWAWYDEAFRSGHLAWSF
jgi:hypothetical protein